jgi:hypothetical protein
VTGNLKSTETYILNSFEVYPSENPRSGKKAKAHQNQYPSAAESSFTSISLLQIVWAFR